MADLHEPLDITSNQAVIIRIHTLGSEHVAVLKPFSVVIQRDGEEFMATWVEANIGSGGETLVAAVSNLQSLIADIFLDLVNNPDETLGPSMRKQKRVLLETLCRAS